jgi:hypothetical protein
MRGALAAGPLCVALLGAGGAHGQGIAPEVEAVGDPLEAEYQAAVQRAQGGDLAGAAVAFDALLGRLTAPHALFTLTPVPGVTATVRTDNMASIHVLETLGFMRLKDRTSYAPLRCLPYQVFDYRLDREAWHGLAGGPVLPLDWMKPYEWTDWAGAA